MSSSGSAGTSGTSGSSGASWRKKRSVFLALVVALVSIVIIWSIPDKPIVTDVIKPSTEPLLTKWVYEHSKQISRTGCKEIVQECLKTNKALLIIALIATESEYNQTAVSPKGATGLTQVMPGVWEKDLISKGIIKERRDLFDLIPSVRAGDYVLSSCLVQSKGDVTKALELYLGGQDGYYVKRILSNLANLYVLVEVN